MKNAVVFDNRIFVGFYNIFKHVKEADTVVVFDNSIAATFYGTHYGTLLLC